MLGKLNLVLEQDHSDEKVRSYLSNIFNLNGLDERTGLSISMERCFMRQWHEAQTYNLLSGDFSPLDMILGKENLTKTFTSNIKFHFGLTNVFRIRRTNLSTEKVIFKKKDRKVGEFDLRYLDKFVFLTQLGKLEFYNYSNIDEKEKIMLNFKLPLITAGISIEYSKNNYNVDSIRTEVLKKIEDFVMLSSLIQGCKHDWKFVMIESQDKPILIHIRALKHSSPNYFPLDNGLDNFVLYEQLEKLSANRYKKKILLALDWYLESILNEELESKFLQMATALECMLDGYHKGHNSQFILSELEFCSLQQKIIPEILEALNELGIKDEEHSEKIKTVKDAFQNLRRRTLANKFRIMLDRPGIDYSDVGLKPNIIVRIRNEITHQGGLSYVNNERKLQEVYNQYKAL
jgi:hypothetical protein